MLFYKADMHSYNTNNVISQQIMFQCHPSISGKNYLSEKFFLIIWMTCWIIRFS